MLLKQVTIFPRPDQKQLRPDYPNDQTTDDRRCEVCTSLIELEKQTADQKHDGAGDDRDEKDGRDESHYSRRNHDLIPFFFEFSLSEITRFRWLYCSDSIIHLNCLIVNLPSAGWRKPYFERWKRWWTDLSSRSVMWV